MPDKTCKLTHNKKYNAEWCKEVGGKAAQCVGCVNRKL
jgi:hypothetical protein